MRDGLPNIRRSLRLANYDYTQAGIYFFTVCTWQREPLLGSVVEGRIEPLAAGRAVEQAWDELPIRFPALVLDAFVLMPDHIHGIIGLGGDADLPTGTELPSLPAVMRAFKSTSGVAANRALGRSGQPFWQRSYHDRIVRNDRELALIRRYIEENPARWGQETDPLFSMRFGTVDS